MRSEQAAAVCLANTLGLHTHAMIDLLALPSGATRGAADLRVSVEQGAQVRRVRTEAKWGQGHEAAGSANVNLPGRHTLRERAGWSPRLNGCVMVQTGVGVSVLCVSVPCAAAPARA